MSFTSQSVFLQAVQSRTRTTVACLIFSLLAMPVWANDYAEVNRLIRAGQWNEALSRADAYLMSRPQDPQMRFIKGVILTETNKASEAIATFQKLTEEFPELPEPYNNLAVLYAAQNQYDKARLALEMAIRTNPSYATAHENLGDVYAKLASQSYSKALQLDNSNTVVPPKLALIRNLLDNSTKPAKSTSSSTPLASTGLAATTAKPVTSTASVTANTTVESSKVRDEVTQAVQAWAKAWSSKDMTAYLSAYDNDFHPPNGRTRSSWEQDRRERITSKSSITVEVTNIEIKLQNDKATVTFRQNYKADALAANSRKTLELIQRNGRWLILRESTG